MPTPTKGARLGGSPSHERIILANLASQLFEHKRIVTTEAKARRVRPLAEKLITKAKRGDLHSRRQVMTTIRDKSIVHELFTEIGPSFEGREGGYTRITKVGPRKGDNAPMAVIELVTESIEDSQKANLRDGASAKKAPAKKAAAAADTASDAKDYGEGSFRGEEPPAGFDIKGNEDSMKFHTTESPWYGATVAEVWFNSEDAAQAAGFVNAQGESAEAAPSEDAAEPATLVSEEAAAPEAEVAESDAKDHGEGSFRGEEPPAGFDIKGNEDSMKFHTTASQWYDSTVAEVWFESEAAAEAAGFTKAG